MHGVERIVADMCCFGMKSSDKEGIGLVKKPTGFLTNAECIARELSQRCVGGHRHVHLIGGKASAAEVYPYDLCCAILVGLKKQLTLDGRLKNGEPLLQLCHDINNVENWTEVENAGEDEYYDDISGLTLDSAGVTAARKKEIDVFKQHEVYRKVPLDECWKVTGKGPIGTKWIDINKGDVKEPELRSRLVAKEIKRDNRDDMFAATPPLEAKKALFSLAVTSEYGKRTARRKCKKKLLCIDVRRAYFYAAAKRDVYVVLPDEDAAPGMCGKLMKSM